MTVDRPDGAGGLRLRRPAALLGALALTAAAVTALTVSPAAHAADTPKTALGKSGQKLTVSASANLDPDGDTIKVTGEGYDATKSIYVALCKDNGDNRIPTPCLGGADQSGTGSASQWITYEGDTYAGELAVHWGTGGTFDVDIAVKSKDSSLDCTQVTCSVVTRVDHRNAGDRSQDVRIPVTFEGQDNGGGDDGGDGVDVPAGTVSYVKAAEFTTAGRPQDLLLHPDSGKLYVGSNDILDTSDVKEQGLYALDPQDGSLLGHVQQAPGSTGALAARVVRWIAAPLAGDGVVFHYPLRGIGTAKIGDTTAKGVWLTGGTVTGVGPGTDAATILVAQGATLSEVETATGTVRRTTTLEGGGELGVDTAHSAAWSLGTDGDKRVLRRVDTASFAVTATAVLPDDGFVTMVEADPTTGNVWVGVGTSVLVLDKDAKLLKTLTGADRPMAAAFDKTSGRAFVLREDVYDGSTDAVGSLDVLDTATFEKAAEPVALPGSIASTAGALAVTPGATSVYVTAQTESKVLKFDLRVSPKVVQSPTDQTVAPGDEVTFVAAAEGTPEPTVTWSVSPDGGQTWSKIEGAAKNAYTFTAKAAQDGYEYRAEFTNAAGTTRTSPLTLTVVKEEDPGDGTGSPTPTASADTEPSGTRTVTGPEGQKLTVTPVNNLAVTDQKLKVTGSGYDEDKGIYVALCVDNGEGELPTPCVGGVDMTGESHSSAWISSNPPDYGEDLATPYEDGGSFAVELTVDAKDEFTDCFEAKCVLVTRADHTLSGDRSQDVKVPVAFVGQDPVDTDDETGTDDGTATPDASASASAGSGSGGTTGGTGTGTSTTGSTTTGGSLASTGVTVLSVAVLAAALTGAGWVAYRRGRTVN
ncbi:immunoglobulin I-set domain protein [Streptomyces sp. S3(2020)]|uniref:immunoglobulin domain-containing protein n=1 Tax=Streptomyces sp. S3(2020) TaxID=2732044 RepID=UPI0014896CCE|nr:immunoglobulin domain-containing protein [Streptomyces sp. S3(2020)]NNN36591.1 immunoglobulin I-set domain protein [Streptomyces sp. S3(2020)]